MEFPSDNSATPVEPYALRSGASNSPPVPARTVMEMASLALQTCFSRIGTTILFSLPLFVFITLPGFVANWLSYRQMGEMVSSLADGLTMEKFDPRAVASLLKGASPDMIEPQGSLVVDLLGIVGFFGAIIFGPIVQAALVALVTGEGVGVRVGARNAWRAVSHRAGPVVGVEIVKFILMFIVSFISVLAGVIVILVGGMILDAVSGPAAALVVFLLIFAAGMTMLGPMVFVFMIWIYTIPLVLFEGVGVSDALGRSMRMVRYRSAGQSIWHTHPMRLTGLLTVVGIVLLVAALPSSAPIVLWGVRAFQSLASDPFGFFDIPASVFIASTILFGAQQVVLMPLFQGSIGLYYLDSRVRDESGSGGGTPLREYFETLAGGKVPAPALGRAPAPPPVPVTGPLTRPSEGLPTNWPDGM